jgi:hypothetical protein
VDGPLTLGKGGEVPTKPLPESIGTTGLDGATVAPGAVGDEVGGHESLYRREVTSCEQVLEPALDDAFIQAHGTILPRTYGALYSSNVVEGVFSEVRK